MLYGKVKINNALEIFNFIAGDRKKLWSHKKIKYIKKIE